MGPIAIGCLGKRFHRTLAADFCDELASSIGDMRHQVESLTKRVSNIEEQQLIVIDRKITDCCSDSLRLRGLVIARRVEALKARPNPTHQPAKASCTLERACNRCLSACRVLPSR